MPPEQILAMITSGDTQQVWRASNKIIELSQNRNALLPLLQHLDVIKQQTKGLQMGGMLAPNQRFIDLAIRILTYHRDSTACTCHLYPHHEGFNPATEVKKGNIAMVNTVMQQHWVDYYLADCLACQQPFKIIERESHYMWWGWKEVKR